MAFKLTTDPSDVISNEAGTPVVTGGTYTGGGTHLLNETGVPVTGGTVYALTAPVTGSGAGLHWMVELTTPEYVWADPDGREPDTITGAGESVRTWSPAEDGTARFSLVITGDATVTTPTVAPHTGMIVIVAGNKNGAHLEIKPSGLHAHNAAGAQTAHIDGNEGVFVGGEFRTSDALPGQVVMSDTALVLDGGAGPGIAVTPINALPYSEMPGIGPAYDGMTISGGSFITGESSGMRTAPDTIQQWAYTAGGGYSQVYTTGLQTRMERLNDAGELQSAINASNTQASIAFLTSPGDSKGLYVRTDGVWVGVRVGGVLTEYNLLETAQDSGWITLAPNAGFTATSLAYRNKGGVIYFHGYVEGTFAADTWIPVFSVPTEVRPMYATFANEAGSGEAGVEIRMNSAGVLSFRTKTAGSKLLRPSALTYPAG